MCWPLTPVAPDDEPRLQPLTRHLRDLGRDVSGIALATAVSMLRIQTRAAPGAVGGLRRHPDPDSERSPAAGRGHPRPRGPRPRLRTAEEVGGGPPPFNMTGQPAINLRCTGPTGLPVECSS